MHYTFW